jgi:4-hydroxy-tetrahydrodipicolinate synthase
MFEGLYVAIVTPFMEDGALNEEKLRELVRFHISAGTDGLVPCGTTGENPACYSWDEHFRIIRIVVEEAKGRLKVVAGAGTNSTTRTIENLRILGDLGADGALVITPYYNKPSQAGMAAHFTAAAEHSSLPLVLYNVPSRTGVNLLPETLAAIADHPRIVAIKEASGDLVQATEILNLCGDRIELISGEDGLIFPMLCIGGVGVISVLGNIVPKDVLAMIKAFHEKDYDSARSWHQRLLPLVRALFLETNPMPVKAALNMLGFEVGQPRLPLVEMQSHLREKLEQTLVDYSLLRGSAVRQ